MTTNLIHTLEALSIFLMLVMLFQIRKHYKLFSNPKLQATHNQKAAETKTSSRPTLHTFNQEKPAPKYYFNKLPELEVSISSDHDIASFTKKPFMNGSALSETTLKKASIRNSFTKKKRPKPEQAPRATHKVILNNYIDDFFTEPEHKEVKENDHFACLDFQVNSPANDEIITVIEPTEVI